ncbi:MAG: hypothetical protein FJZ58_00960 [Chlamydiae bacterium]|nr:hypothetical protein [Chlamydiota bacterium]
MITFDHSYIYLDHEKFFPVIQEEGDYDEDANAVLLRLDCSQGDLLWQSAHDQAKSHVTLGKRLVWDLDFGFAHKPIFLQDTATFFAATLLIEEFLETLWKPFQEHTLAVCLFRGDVDVAKYFLWTEQQEQLYLERMQDFAILSQEEVAHDFLRKIFAVDVFSDYLHRLTSVLPDTLPAICCFDVTSMSSASASAFLLSKDRFPYVLLAVKGAWFPFGQLSWEKGLSLGGWIGRSKPPLIEEKGVSIAFCLPSLENKKLSWSHFHQIDEILEKLSHSGRSYRIVEERYLHESWDGIDDLIVCSELLEEEGLRKVKGFLAAGGRVITEGDLLALL